MCLVPIMHQLYFSVSGFGVSYLLHFLSNMNTLHPMLKLEKTGKDNYIEFNTEKKSDSTEKL
jgi:hypothetical protein